ncbi:MAG: TetR/AcrR family transcriptional regulator [Salinivirgaceae bacterium]|jgi:AcrR family transcriptional regulator|nr:TetR/AcrR family transcriptional regulator [Salinivirgaceae bacterium]
MNLKNSKEAILNQALSIFGRLGFHKTTMADIAEASKRGRRTIYTYFKNKEEVYEAVVEREIERVIENLKKEIQSTDSVKEKFNNYINSRLRAIIALTKNYAALRTAFLNNYKWVEKIRLTLDQEEKIILNQLLELGANKQVFTIKDKASIVKSIMLMIKGIEYVLIKENNEEITKLQVSTLQHLLQNGLLKRN